MESQVSELLMIEKKKNAAEGPVQLNAPGVRPAPGHDRETKKTPVRVWLDY
jgi:hypothetical protein